MSIINSLKNRLFKKTDKTVKNEEIDLPAKRFMIYRNEIDFIYEDCTLEEVYNSFMKNKQMLLPICRKNNDDVIGALSIHSLLTNIFNKKPWNYNLNKNLEKILFISSYTDIFYLKTKMIKENVSLAIVVNEFGSVEGMININHIINDFNDADLKNISLANENFINGKTLLSDLKDILNIENNDYTSTTIGGFLVEYLGKVPEENEEILINNYIFKILKATDKSIHKLIIKKNNIKE